MGRSHPAWPALAAALLALAVHLNALGNGFAFDDRGAILQNSLVTNGDVGAILTSDYWAGHQGLQSGLYRPVVSLTFALEYALFGDWALPYHLTNLLLHAAVCAAVCALAHRLSGAGLAWLAGAVFAVHPLHTEAVVGLVGRADLLCTLWIVLGILARIPPRGAEPGSAVAPGPGPARRLPYGTAAALGLGLLCKEQAVILPLLAVLVDWWSRCRGRLIRLPVGEYAALGTVVGAYLLLRLAVLGGLTVAPVEALDNPLVELPPPWRHLQALAIATLALRLLVLPHGLSADYSYGSFHLAAHPSAGPLLAALLAVSALAGAVLSYRRRPEIWSLGGLWMAASYGVVANVLVTIGTMMADRLLYLPSVGVCLVFAACLTSLVRRIRFAGLALVAGLLLCYAVLTWQRTADWRSNLTLFQSVLRSFPANARAHNGLATALRDASRWAEAEYHYRQALRSYPRYAQAHYNLGVLLLSLHRYAEAEQAFEEAIRLRPGHAESWLNLGMVRQMMGQVEPADAAYREALTRRPDWPDAWYNLAGLHYEAGDWPTCARAYRHLLDLRPDHPEREDIRRRLGQCASRADQ